MKLLWFSHVVPFPPRGGNLQRSFNLLRQVARKYEASLVAFNLLGETPAQLHAYEAELRKYCARVEFWELPYRWRSARWWAELAMSPLFEEPFVPRSFWSRGLAARWARTLEEHRGALVHFDAIDLGLYASAADGFRKVLNHHNCESAMARRRAEAEPHAAKKALLSLQADKLERLEKKLCHRFDANTVVSASDGELLGAINPRAHIHVVENGVDIQFFNPSGSAPEPGSVVFTGSLDWYPNVSGLQFFAREVWPLIRSQRPDARLYLAGKNPPASLLALAESDPQIRVIASPDDIRPWLDRGAVFICPILDGGGTRLKILDAMAMAKPIVSTTIGCEGLEVTHGENILVADAPQDFADRVLSLLGDSGERKRLGAGGRALVERRYSWEKIAVELDRAYRHALDEGARAGDRVDEPETAALASPRVTSHQG